MATEPAPRNLSRSPDKTINPAQPTNTTTTTTSSSQHIPSIRPSLRPTPSESKPTSTTSKPPPVTLPSSSHLDPNAYVRGTNPITIGHGVLVHPRAQLLSIHSPLVIGDGCIVSEKAVLGGPVPVSASSSSSNPTATATAGSSALTPTLASTTVKGTDDENGNAVAGRATSIGKGVHFHPNVQIFHGARVGDFVVLESNVSIRSDVVIGSHSKVCAGLDVTFDVPEWTVVWGGGGEVKRRRRKGGMSETVDGGIEVVETERLKAMDKERDGTMTILRNAALKTAAMSGRKK